MSTMLRQIALWPCVVVALIAAMAACSPASPYRAEKQRLPSPALQAALQTASSSPALALHTPLPNNWWELFNDQQLADYILGALDKNPSLQKARAAILTSAYQAGIARSSLYPNLLWGADVSRQKLSETGLIPLNPTTGTAATAGAMGTATPPIQPLTAGSNGIPVYFTQYETELTLTYDFDLWGKNRHRLQAALGQMQAKIADQEFVRLQLSIAVARSYFSLQIAYQRQEVAQAMLANKMSYFALIGERVQNNIDNNLALYAAEADVATAKANVWQLQSEIDIAQHQLQAYLAGNFEEIAMPLIQPLPRVPLPDDLPLGLIARRPDIIAKLWLISAAGKQIAVAQAGFYPDVNLYALLGLQTLQLNKLLEGRSGFFNVDPAVSLPLFDGGFRRSNLHEKESSYDEAVYEYNNLVLNAVQEVLDGITTVRHADEQWRQYEQNALLQLERDRLTHLLYSHNLASDLDQLTSRDSALTARDQELVALGQRIQAILSLIKALGGGYNMERR